MALIPVNVLQIGKTGSIWLHPNASPTTTSHMRSSSALCALFALCSVSAAPLFDEAYVRARIISTEALTRGRSEMPVVARPITDSLPAAFDARTEWSNCTVRPP